MTYAMTTYEALGWSSQFGTRAEAAWGVDAGAVTQRFLIDSGGLLAKGTILERDALRGDRSSQADDSRTGPYTVSGTVMMRPTPEDLAIWIPRILGGTPSGTAYALANVLPSFSVCEDKLAQVPTYNGCKVNKATFSFRKGDFMKIALDIVGATETMGAGGSFPTLTGSKTTPFIICDSILTLIATARAFEDAELVINNNLITDNFKNSCTIVSLDEGPRVVTLKTTHAYNLGNIDLYNQALAGSAGTLALTTGNYGCSFTFGTLQVPRESPSNSGKGEIPLVLDMIARMTGTTKEIAVTLDSTG